MVSSGGSPDMWSDEGLEPVTEYRAGTYVYFDRALMEVRRLHAGGLRRCKVRTTVVSVPTPDRAILDAGSKALTSDLIGLPDYGCVPALSDARVYKLNEEHGYLDISGVADEAEGGRRARRAAEPRLPGQQPLRPHRRCRAAAGCWA